MRVASRHDPNGPRRWRVRRTPCRAASMTRSDTSVGPTSTQSPDDAIEILFRAHADCPVDATVRASASRAARSVWVA